MKQCSTNFLGLFPLAFGLFPREPVLFGLFPLFGLFSGSGGGSGLGSSTGGGGAESSFLLSTELMEDSSSRE